MLKVLAIGGQPGTGKSTVVQALATTLRNPRGFSFGTLKGLVYAQNAYILGRYEEGDVTPGTDRLSMSVQPHVEGFLKHLASLPEDSLVIYEGDRLFNQKMLQFVLDLPGAELKAILLTAPKSMTEERLSSRGSNQNEKWKKGRETKAKNLVSLPFVLCLPNGTAEEFDYLMTMICAEVG